MAKYECDCGRTFDSMVDLDECQANGHYMHHGPVPGGTFKPDWRPFDPTVEINKRVWLAGKQPVYDVDVDNNGLPVLGVMIGEEAFSVIAWITTTGTGDFEITPEVASRGNYIYEEAIFTHIADFKEPELPDELKNS